MKPVLITGASGGIGLALVDALISSGNRNVLCQYRSNGKALFDLLEKHDIDANKQSFYADLTSENQISNMKSHFKENFGLMWGVVNLAGCSSNGMSWKIPKEEFRRVLENNLITTFSVCKTFIPDMREQNGGRIINVSSVVGSTGAIGAAHYAAAKTGIEGFTRSIALELASKNVTANCLALGYFEYGLINHLSEDLQQDVRNKTPLKRFGNAREIAGAIKFLVSDEGSFTTGQIIHINGGIHL